MDKYNDLCSDIEKTLVRDCGIINDNLKCKIFEELYYDCLTFKKKKKNKINKEVINKEVINKEVINKEVINKEKITDTELCAILCTR